MKISSHGGSHTGCVRENNEDAFLILPSGRLFAVADGLGGLPDGEDASRLALEVLSHEANTSLNGHQPDFGAMFRAVNHAVHKVGTSRYEDTSIGTTLTSACVHRDRLFIGHVGDSAALLWRAGELHVLTEEHTMAALYGGSHGSSGGPSLPEYYFHTLTRCIGASDELETSLSDCALVAGDRLLLCTDGLTKILPKSDLCSTLGAMETPLQAVEVLLELALERGAPDNIAVVVAFFEPDL